MTFVRSIAFLTLIYLVVGAAGLAFGANPFEQDLTKAAEVSTGVISKVAAWGLGLTALSAVATTVLPFRFLEDWKYKSYGALVLVVLIFFVLRMFPSVTKAAEDIMTCPMSVFGLKC